MVEVVMIICLAAILFILIRKFPDTAVVNEVSSVAQMPDASARQQKATPPKVEAKPSVEKVEPIIKKVEPIKVEPVAPVVVEPEVVEVPEPEIEPVPTFPTRTLLGRIRRQPEKLPEPVVVEVTSKWGQKIDDLLDEARKLMSDNKQQVAEDKLIEALKENYHCATAYTLLGDIYYSRKRNEEAEESYVAAVKNDADEGDAHFGLAMIYEQNGRLNDASKEVLLATRVDDRNDLWFKKLGDLYMDLRMFAKASMAYNKAFNLRPDYTKYKELAALATKKQQSHKVG